MRFPSVRLPPREAARQRHPHATARNGTRSHNRYCCVIRFEGETIAEVRAYLDSALVQKVIDENNG
jgi:hypothetical protein